MYAFVEIVYDLFNIKHKIFILYRIYNLIRPELVIVLFGVLITF